MLLFLSLSSGSETMVLVAARRYCPRHPRIAERSYCSVPIHRLPLACVFRKCRTVRITRVEMRKSGRQLLLYVLQGSCSHRVPADASSAHGNLDDVLRFAYDVTDGTGPYAK